MDMNSRKEEDCEVLKVNVIVVRYCDGPWELRVVVWQNVEFLLCQFESICR